MKISPANPVRTIAAFTMIEVAICLAIIGIALVGIIGVLPRGMNTQRDNREETIVGQDANQLIQIIQSGARNQDDLTNYVYAITNYWSLINASGSNVASGSNGYTYYAATLLGTTPSPNPFALLVPINSGSNIVSVLSTPEYISINTNNTPLGAPISTLAEGGISNHVVAYVRALSGLAAQEPPQDNSIMQGDAFSYRVLCVNAPMAMDAELWQAGLSYSQGAQVYWAARNWQWAPTTNSIALDVPGNSSSTPKWVRNYYADQLAASQRELRLRFMWPQLPNGHVGGNFQSFRATVAGQLVVTNNGPSPSLLLYYYQPQTFVSVP